MINMTKLLKLMEKYETETGDGATIGATIELCMYSDGSGHVSDNEGLLFEFDDLLELERKLTLKVHWRE